MSVDVPDVDAANAFVTGAYERFSTCLTTFGAVSEAIESTKDLTVEGIHKGRDTFLSFPAMVLNSTQLLIGVALCFYGFKLVRPVNFVAGAFLGSTTSLILLSIFAPALDACPPVVGIALASGLVLGLLCAAARTSMMVVLGLVAGEICGDLFYKTVLAGAGLPPFMAYASIGFWAVLLAVLFGYVGDFSWKLGCAFLGAYSIVVNAIKIGMPYLPDGAKFAAFLAFKPEPTAFVDNAASYGQTIAGSPFVYGPTLALLVLTAVGTYTQVRLLRAANLEADRKSLIMA